MDGRFLITYADVPFAEVAAIVSSVSESASEGGEGFFNVYLVGDDTGFVRVAAGLYAGAAGLA